MQSKKENPMINGKTYENPSIEIVSLKDEDIISTSGGNGIDMPDINIEGEGREI